MNSVFQNAMKSIKPNNYSGSLGSLVGFVFKTKLKGQNKQTKNLRTSINKEENETKLFFFLFTQTD